MASATQSEDSSIKVESLRPGTKGHSLTVKVLEAKPVAGRGRGPGENTSMSECLVGDETGIIVFTARRNQVSDAQPGKYLRMENARIDMYKGSMRLAVDQSGTVEVVEDKFEPNDEYNLSLIEYELVTVTQ